VRKSWMLMALLTFAVPGAAQEAADPQGVVEELFRWMKEGDADRMAALFHPEVRLVTTSVGPDGPRAAVVPVARWLESVGTSERELDERIHDVRVLTDQGLASVWAAYDLYVDGELSHCGVDAFHLVRTAEGWRVLEIVDTRRTEGCSGT
jgi:hypothetical protein